MLRAPSKKLNLVIGILTLPVAAVWTLTANGAPKADATPQHVCGNQTVEKLPPGVRFEFGSELLAEFDLRSQELREPASVDENKPKNPAEVYTPEVLNKPFTWANGNQTLVNCVVVRAAGLPWRWPHNANWKLKSARQHTQATVGATTGVTRAPRQNVYALSLVSRDSQAISLQCTTLEVGHGPWDPKHVEFSIAAFQQLFGESLHPAIAVDNDSASCRPLSG